MSLILAAALLAVDPFCDASSVVVDAETAIVQRDVVQEQVTGTTTGGAGSSPAVASNPSARDCPDGRTCAFSPQDGAAASGPCSTRPLRRLFRRFRN